MSKKTNRLKARVKLAQIEAANERSFAAACRVQLNAMTAYPTKAPLGCIIDDQCNIRKVLGKLPLTADGCVAMPDSSVVCPYGHKAKVLNNTSVYCMEGNCWDCGCQGDSSSGTRHPISECYSTQEAASSAMEKSNP